MENLTVKENTIATENNFPDLGVNIKLNQKNLKPKRGLTY